MTITQADREAASRFIAESDGDYPELCGLFASHRAAGFAAGAVEGAKAMQEALTQLDESRNWTVGIKAHEIRALDPAQIAGGGK